MSAARRLAAVAVIVVTGLGCSNPTYPGGGDTQIAVPPHPGQATAQTEPVETGPTAGDEEVQFTVSLNLRDEDGMTALLERLNDPASLDFHQYISATAFGERFGLPSEDVARVVGWLESAGLRAAAVPQRTSISVSGSASSVNQLLGITLHDWSSPNGERFHRPSGLPAVPAHLSDKVAAVLGLDTEPVLRPAFGGILASGVPSGGLRPNTVARAYEIDPLHAAGMRGEGQVVAIVSFDTFTPSDVDLFDAREGVAAPRVEIVRVPGAADEPGSGTGEVALDIQVIRGIAPQARIINYEGPNTANGFAALMARIVADGLAEIVSISWGLCEKYSSPSALRAEEREFDAAFAAGLSVFVASGDDGAYGCRRVAISDDPFNRDLSQDSQWPSTSASTIGVGGTFLSVREDGTYISEAGWEEPLGGAGGGGGLSTVVDRPSWQEGVGVDNAASNGMRQVPDVAGPSDPSSGFLVVYTEPGQGVVEGQVGGTSAAAPFWAASMALTRQMAGTEGVDSLGALAPTLYQIAAEQPAGAVFHDVIRGGNLLFEAGPGWDYSTGLGSPRVAPLARAIIDFLKR
ncbi:MAG: S53 family peptidase [Chloroflexota bacterium]